MGSDAVIHLAAIEKEQGAATYERVHVEGTRALAQAAERVGVRRFIYMGQISPGNNPRFPFTYSKWRGEEEVRRSPIDWTVLRAGIILGPGDHFVRETLRLSRAPLVPLAGSGKTLLQPIAVWDVAAALASTLFFAFSSRQTLDITGDERLSYAELTKGRWPRWSTAPCGADPECGPLPSGGAGGGGHEASAALT